MVFNWAESELWTFPWKEQGDFSSWLLWVQGDSRSTWYNVRVKGTQAENDEQTGNEEDATI